MLNKSLSVFIQDERGSYTMWSIAWFMIYVGIGGLAVDATDVYRHETLLQATGDASSMAGVMSLPSETEAVDQALAYAQDNMQRTSHGTVLTATDVKVGTWDFDERTFYSGATANPNAVYVTTRREESNQNALPMNMLRFLSLAGGGDLWWNVHAESVAVRYIPECAREGFIAQDEVWWNNGIDFLNNICVHAQMKEVGHAGAANDNYYQPGVSISRGAPADLAFSDSTLATDTDLSAAVDAGGVTEMWPAEASLALEYMTMLETMTGVSQTAFTADENAGLYERYQSWDFLYSPDGSLTLVEEEPSDGVYLPYHVYVINDCNGQLKLDQDTVLENVAIITDCPIQASANISAGNTILASTDTGNKAIHMAADATLGSEGFCDGDNHGVQLYTPGGVSLAAKTDWHGVRVAAGGDVNLAAQNNALGISVQSGGTINFQSGGAKGSKYSLCPNDPPEQGPFEWRYRLVM